MVPRDALDIRHTSTGFVPHLGLHRRGQLYYQESSYSHIWFFGLMILAAGVISMLPWYTLAVGGTKLKYWIAGGCIWAGICGLASYFLRNAFGQTIIIDREKQLLHIRKRAASQTIPCRDVIALQICYQRAGRRSKLAGYQLNLVWKEPNSTVKRHCLLKHAVKRSVFALGDSYVRLFRFNIIDETRNSDTQTPLSSP